MPKDLKPVGQTDADKIIRAGEKKAKELDLKPVKKPKR